MNWKIVENDEDLPQDNELVLIYGKMINDEVQYFKPEKWDKNSYPAKWFFVFKIFKEFAWCKVEAPII
jgi:hypothetical protein